jgi:hypothetical protein
MRFRHSAIILASSALIFTSALFVFPASAGTLTVLHRFSGADGDGGSPLVPLVRGASGSLYDLINGDGESDNSVVFRLITDLRNAVGSEAV